MEKTAKQGENLPVSTSQLFAVLQSRISKQDALIEKQSEKIERLLEICNLQNESLLRCKALDSEHYKFIKKAQSCVNDLVFSLRLESEKKADKEAA
jgi:hypothetical protein